MPHYLVRVLKPKSARGQAKKAQISALTDKKETSSMAKQEPSAYTDMTEDMSSLSDDTLPLIDDD